ncbi:BrnA antitoxin family protein [Faunimonas pinastri]|uniref:BrnA antitoxin family protein n=1 Tax=Faunimonas pinastri TaxID=1855383 RepID=UPI001EE9E82D|nr:BrnA antitoxin family protein [Faunimonas pinastri]
MSKRKPEHISQEDWDAVDSPPLSDEMLARMKPVREVAPELIEMHRQRGRPRSDDTKRSTTLRLSPDVLDHFRSTGPGWQTRIDETLRAAIVRNPSTGRFSRVTSDDKKINAISAKDDNSRSSRLTRGNEPKGSKGAA